jgi:hypothetical protein
MSFPRTVSRIIVPAVLALAWTVVPSTWSAPAPKDEGKAKTPQAEITAEPAPDIKEKEAEHRDTSANNLKQLALAAINCADSNCGSFPRDITDNDGKVLLSWRVHLLPFVEETALYKQFNLDEPWDSINNLKLLEKMPKVFSSPRVFVKKNGYTVYQGFAGPGSAFEPNKQLRFPASFTDGTSNTIMVVESSTAVPWTKPADLPFDPKKNVHDFGKAFGGKPLAGICDGSTRTIDLKKISQATLKAAITTAGGEILGEDW